MDNVTTDNKIYKHIDELREWDKNPREISDESYQRLKDQLSLKGQFVPLLIMPDGLVLGGNMRLKALKELGWEKVWVSIVEFQVNTQNLWYAILDGVQRPETYPTKDDAMMSWSIAHNADYGHYDIEKFKADRSNYDIDWDQFAINFAEPETISDLLDGNGSGIAEKGIGYQIIILADDQQTAEQIFNKMVSEGYNTKIKAQARRKK